MLLVTVFNYIESAIIWHFQYQADVDVFFEAPRRANWTSMGKRWPQQPPN